MVASPAAPAAEQQGETYPQPQQQEAQDVGQRVVVVGGADEDEADHAEHHQARPRGHDVNPTPVQ